MTDTLKSPTRRELRRRLREARRSLGRRAQQRAAEGLRRVLTARPEVLRARRIAIYLPQDGEIDPLPLIARLAHRRRNIYLPRLDPIRRGGSRRLRFAPWLPDAHFRENYFGIPEPLTRPIPAWTLDVVLLPLVGFDAEGNRLGMGGGFYDRTFHPGRARPRQPLLIGIAHALQQVEALPAAAHDVRLHAIATDQAYHPVLPRAAEGDR